MFIVEIEDQKMGMGMYLTKDDTKAIFERLAGIAEDRLEPDKDDPYGYWFGSVCAHLYSEDYKNVLILRVGIAWSPKAKSDPFYYNYSVNGMTVREYWR